MGRRLLAALLQLALGLPLLLVSCTAPMIPYVQSARWFVAPVAEHLPATFFVAFSDGPGGRVQVAPYRAQRQGPADSVDYRLAPGRHELQGSAFGHVEVLKDAGEDLLVRVSVAGDTPWASLSEYRVHAGAVQPLRHGQSAPWVYVAGLVVALVLLGFVLKALTRWTRRLVGLEGREGAPSS